MKVTTNINLSTSDVKQAIAEFLADRGYELPTEGEIGFVTSPNTVMAQVTITDYHEEVREPKFSLDPGEEDLDVNGRDIRAYFSPDLMDSFGETLYTVLGYLAEYHPGIIEVAGDAASCTQRDGFWLKHRYPDPAKVRAPKVLREQGIEEVNCYPVDLLHQRFGAPVANTAA